jgi:group I intron endonuclease
MEAHIYCVTNVVSGKQYVGQTTVDKNKFGHGKALSRAYKLHGKKAFIYDRLYTNITTREQLNLLEKFWINTLNTVSPNGYNIELGGTDKGEIADSTKQKLREANLGKKMSEVTKQKLSFANKGEKNSFYGKTHSPEAMAKIIQANVGKVVVISEETKEKIRQSKIGAKNPMYGKPITEEHRSKLKTNSAKNKPWLGKKLTNEHKLHLSVVRVCSHCNKIGKGNAMLRYHFDNCKRIK